MPFKRGCDRLSFAAMASTRPQSGATGMTQQGFEHAKQQVSRKLGRNRDGNRVVLALVAVLVWLNAVIVVMEMFITLIVPGPLK